MFSEIIHVRVRELVIESRIENMYLKAHFIHCVEVVVRGAVCRKSTQKVVYELCIFFYRIPDADATKPDDW